jgi:hypothetical protein
MPSFLRSPHGLPLRASSLARRGWCQAPRSLFQLYRTICAGPLAPKKSATGGPMLTNQVVSFTLVAKAAFIETSCGARSTGAGCCCAGSAIGRELQQQAALTSSDEEPSCPRATATTVLLPRCCARRCACRGLRLACSLARQQKVIRLSKSDRYGCYQLFQVGLET